MSQFCRYNEYKSGKITAEECVEELYRLCNHYQLVIEELRDMYLKTIEKVNINGR